MKKNKSVMDSPVFAKKSNMPDPYQELDEIFDYAHMDELEIQLWEWLKTTVSGNFSKELSRTERSSLLTLYEKMQQLLKAAHQIHLHTQKAKMPKRRQ